MTEHNLFCYSEKYSDENSFQQKPYRAFNKEVGKNRYFEIRKIVIDILGEPKLKLKDSWKQVTDDQWKQLLAIPEAKDSKEGFEFISGVKIDLDNKVKIVVEGKEVFISRESARALGLIE